MAVVLLLAAACTSQAEINAAPEGSETSPTLVSIEEETDTTLTNETTVVAGDATSCFEQPALTITDTALTELLAFVPDTEATREHMIFSHPARAYADLEIAVPSAECDSIDWLDWAEPAIDGIRLPVGTAGNPRFELIAPSQNEAWGFSFLDHRAELLTGDSSDELKLRLLDVPVSDVREAVVTDPTWSGSSEVVGSELEGAFVVDWGNEIDLDRKSPARPLGRGGVLAVVGDVAAQANTLPVVEGALAAAANDRSLGNNQAFGTLAGELDALGVHAAYLLGRPYDEAEIATRGTILGGDYPRMPVPEAFAVGWVKHPDETVTGTVILVADSVDDAAAIESVLEQRLEIGNVDNADLGVGSYERVDLESRDNLVFLTLDASSAFVLWRLEYESLLFLGE